MIGTVIVQDNSTGGREVELKAAKQDGDGGGQ